MRTATRAPGKVTVAATPARPVPLIPLYCACLRMNYYSAAILALDKAIMAGKYRAQRLEA